MILAKSCKNLLSTFQPGKTNTSLLSYKRKPEALNFGNKVKTYGIFYEAKMKTTGQPAQMDSLSIIFDVYTGKPGNLQTFTHMIYVCCQNS